MAAVWSVIDHVPPELFPEFEQTIALDEPAIVTVAPEPDPWWKIIPDDAWQWGVSVWPEGE